MPLEVWIMGHTTMVPKCNWIACQTTLWSFNYDVHKNSAFDPSPVHTRSTWAGPKWTSTCVDM